MGYSFTWILNHLSQSYQVASASWAGYAVSASYVPLLAGPNITINYQSNGIAITGSGGSGNPGGPLTSIQFNSASAFSGSANFTFSSGSSTIYLTGSMIVSGGISASYGANTIGFIGTASWAQSASNAFTASFITASNVWGPYGTSSVISASIAVTASFAGAAGSTLSASYADYAAVAGTLTDNIWVRSSGDTSAVINDDSAHTSIADGQSAVAYGDLTYTFGDYASSQGKNTEAIGVYTHAEGVSTYAIGEGSHTEGYNTRTGIEGQPYYPEETYITSSNFKTYTQFSASLVPSASATLRSDQAPLVSIDDPNSSMYGLTFQFLYDSGSVSGSNNRYESGSVAIYDSVTRNLLAHENLSKFYDTSSMDGALPRAITVFQYGPVAPQQAWHEKHTDTIKVAFSHFGQGFTAYIGMISCSYDGITLSSLYIHNTASYHPVSRLANGLGGSHVGSGNNVVNNWTGSIASETRWTGSAPSVQFNGSVVRSYPPMPGTFYYGGFYNITYNPYNNKTYAIGDWIQNSPYSGPSGIYIFNSDFQLEYTGSIGTSATTGIGSGGTLSYQIHGGTVPAFTGLPATTTDIGFRSTISGSSVKGAKPAVDKNGNVWFTTNTTTAGNPVHLFALKANGSVSSSNANLFAYVINHQSMGISASALSPPYYYPGDGTTNSERIFVCVNYPYGSGSINTSYTKWLGYDLTGLLKDNPWGNAATPTISVQRITKGNFGLYWWNKEKVFVIKPSGINTISILSKDGIVQATTTANRPGSLFEAGALFNVYEVPQNRTLVVEGFYSPTSETPTGSLFWIDKLITSASVGQYSHAEGIGSAAGGIGSHAEGYYAVATGSYSHAEGVNTRAIASGSHSEGLFTTASGDYSHTEGSGSVASGIGSHAEGKDTIARGQYSHAEGSSSIAFGTGSHAGGLFTVASGSFQTTVGTYNLLNNTTDLFVIGDGASTASRHDLLNASTGVVRISGSLIVSNSLAVSGSVSFSGSFAAGNVSLTGSLYGTSSWSVSSSWTQPGGPYTSIQFNDSNTLSGSANYTFNKSINRVQLTGSLFVSGTLVVSSSNTNQTQPAMQVNSEGVLGIGEFSVSPTVVVGAIIYSGSDYYLGFP